MPQARLAEKNIVFKIIKVKSTESYSVLFDNKLIAKNVAVG